MIKVLYLNAAMIKLIILLILTIPIGDSQPINIKKISISSKEYEEKHNIKISKAKEYKCESSEFLNLSDMKLRMIKNDIIRSDAIRHASLSNNSLKKIPQNILDYMPHLLCFNLSRNSINLYQDNQIRHPYLQVLDLSYQKITDVNSITPEVEIFDETEYVHSFKHMLFNSTKMKLPSAEYLDLSGNDISSLLWEFNKSFPKLIRLDLININAKALETNFFDKISSLRVLHLENNYLRNLTLRNVAEITALYLDGNPIETLDVTSTKLRMLSLSNCINLRTGVFNTPYLEELDLSKNNFDNVFGIHFDMFRSLRVLIFDYNVLSSIPSLNNPLNELSLSYNMIKYIKPNSFEHLTSLIKLSLKGNGIDHLEKETFSGLEKLEYLDLSENEFSYLPSDWASPLKKLQYLNVCSNKFASISEMGIYSIHSLQYLFVKNNNFTKITTLEIEPLPDYITIYLA